MTTNTEAREAVARFCCDKYWWDDYALGGTPNGQIQRKKSLERADAILARLGELGYVQRDRLPERDDEGGRNAYDPHAVRKEGTACDRNADRHIVAASTGLNS